MIVPTSLKAIIMAIINNQKAEQIKEQHKTLKEKGVFCQRMNSLLMCHKNSKMIVVVQMISLAIIRINIC